ncbi:hypothetical protein DVH05_010826 [Phytophthora capsici]|nr:hypothetical protein DVH05_010826 [Phytophthora capsici]
MSVLVCAFVGDTGSAFFIQLDEGDLVGNVKEKIKKKQKNDLRDVDASRLELFLAKKGTEWLTSTGLLEEDESHYLGEALEDPLTEICPKFPRPLPSGSIHVLVKVQTSSLGVRARMLEMGQEDLQSSAKKQRTDTWKWVEREPTFFLEKKKLFFVNRDLATKQLQDIFENKFYRALNHVGAQWEIPLLDNICGLGKTTFGYNFIRKCREIWGGKANANSEEFMPVLCACHTLHISLEPGSLLTDNPQDRYEMDKKVIDLICDFFDQKFQERPRALDPTEMTSATSSGQVLKKLTAEVGPLFIVLDEIGQGFYDENIDKFGQRDRFMEFCRVVLAKWLLIPKVFFLIAGRASFLGYVGLRPEPLLEIQPTQFKISRLSLHRLRWSAIEQIITNTFVDENEMKSIKQHFNLSAEQVVEIAHNLFDVTLGHPRSLLAAFLKCHSYEDLANYDGADVSDCIDWVEYTKRIPSYAVPLEKMMSRATDSKPVNMADTWKDDEGKEILYDAIANSFGIAWEGTVDKAMLYMPPFTRQLILAFLYPLRKYLLIVAKSKDSFDYPAVFEWVCLKRFQELFEKNVESHGCPKDTLSGFFTDQQTFGRCTGVQFSEGCPLMPKIAKNGSLKSTLHSPTASPELWPTLMTEIDKIFVDEHRLNLKPLQKSASADVILMTQIDNTKLTIGLAVKKLQVRHTIHEKNVDKGDRDI